MTDAAQPSAPRTGALAPADIARDAGVELAFVEGMIRRQLIRPSPDGSYSLGDISAVKLARAFSDGGMDLDVLADAIRSEAMITDLSWVAETWPPQPLSGRTYRDFAESLAEHSSLLPSLYLALGLAEPPPEAMMPRDEESALTDLIRVWLMVDEEPEVVVNAARIAGEGARRIQQATLDLLDDRGGSPPQRQARGITGRAVAQPSLELLPMLSKLVTWLLARHSQDEIFGRVVEHVEGQMTRSGRIERAERDPQAVAFVDLAGFTELTEQGGDQLAADYSLELQKHAQRFAREHRGRVVKLLGDGVMIRYPSGQAAVDSVLGLMQSLVDGGLPPAHAGVAAGQLVLREGDVFGRTVNMASRLAGQARPGELIVADELGALLQARGYATEDCGSVQIKGVAAAVRLTRIVGLKGGG